MGVDLTRNYTNDVVKVYAPLIFRKAKKMMIFIIHPAKTRCIAFVFYGETFVYQNCGETVLYRGESVFIRTGADKRVSAIIY